MRGRRDVSSSNERKIFQFEKAGGIIKNVFHDSI